MAIMTTRMKPKGPFPLAATSMEKTFVAKLSSSLVFLFDKETSERQWFINT